MYLQQISLYLALECCFCQVCGVTFRLQLEKTNISFSAGIGRHGQLRRAQEGTLTVTRFPDFLIQPFRKDSSGRGFQIHQKEDSV